MVVPNDSSSSVPFIRAVRLVLVRRRSAERFRTPTGATSVDLTISIAIEDGDTIEFTHTVEMVNSPNVSGDPYLSADSVRLSSLASNQVALTVEP